MRRVHHLEEPQQVYWLARLHNGQVWWGGKPTTKSRRLRLLSVEMVESKPHSRNSRGADYGFGTFVESKSTLNFEFEESKPMNVGSNFGPSVETLHAADSDLLSTSTKVRQEATFEPSETYLRVKVLDTESGEHLFLRVQRTKLHELRSMKEVRNGGLYLIGDRGYDTIALSDGKIKGSEWVSATLSFSSPTQLHAGDHWSANTFHFEDLAVAVLAVTNVDFWFSSVEPHMQSYWFCHLTMMVLKISLRIEIIEHGLDDTRGKLRVCVDWDRGLWLLKRRPTQDWKPIWKDVKVEKIVEPFLDQAMQEIEVARYADANGWLSPGSSTLTSRGSI